MSPSVVLQTLASGALGLGLAVLFVWLLWRLRTLALEWLLARWRRKHPEDRDDPMRDWFV